MNHTAHTNAPGLRVTLARLLPLLPLLLSLQAIAATSALAQHTENGLTGLSFTRLAQMGLDERRALRERWDNASPEERVRLRQFFQDRLNSLPAPAQAGIGMPFPGLGQNNTGPNPEDSLSGGFGFGFEKRHLQQLSPVPPLWPGNR